MQRSITKPTDRLPAIAGLASEFHSVLGSDTYRFGVWMKDPVSLLWSFDRQSISDTLVTGVPSWSWARDETGISWRSQKSRYFVRDWAWDWKQNLLVQCLDTSGSKFSTHELHVRGNLLMLNGERVCVYWEYIDHLWSEAIGEPSCFINMDRRCQHQPPKHNPISEAQEESRATASDIPTNLRILPIADISDSGAYSIENDQLKLQAVWCMVVQREPELRTAMYTRVGVAVLAAPREKAEGLFPLLKEGLNEDDYLDMDDDGTCTIVVV